MSKRQQVISFLSITMTLMIVFSLLPASVLAANPNINFISYESVSAFSDGMARVKLNGKYGYINSEGKLVIECKFDYAKEFQDGLAAVSMGGSWDEDVGYVEGVWGFIDKTGNVVIPLIYDYAWNFYEGYAAVIKDGGMGFIDKSGNMRVPFTYAHAANESYKFSEGMAVVSEGDFEQPVYSVVDTSGNVLFTLPYGYARHYSEGMLAVANNGYWGIGGAYYWGRTYNDAQWGFVDNTGKEIVKPIYDYVGDFKEGIAIVGKDGKYGAIDKTGKVVVPIIYDDIFSNGAEGLLGVYTNGAWGYVDYNGKIVIPAEYDIASKFSEGIATVSKDGKWGAIDKEGNTIISFKYDNLWNFSEGFVRARLEEGGKWGYLDKNGTLVIDPVFSAATDFKNSKAIIYQEEGDKYGIISSSSILYTAVPTSSKVLVNGEIVAFDAYNINGNNYFKLRDLAKILSGTKKQFEVAWDYENRAIMLISGKAYTTVGDEMVKGDGLEKSATLSISPVYKDGERLYLTAFNINGNNYFKLRDIGKAFNFSVSWDGKTNTIAIDTTADYKD